MMTILQKPWLDPTATALRAAFAASAVAKTAAAEALKISAGTISNMCHAKAAVSAAQARVLGKILGVDPATIVSPAPPGKPVMGPAQRAMVLHEAAPVVQTLPRPEPLFGMQALSDGTTHVWCKITLPHDRGAALFRMLLDFDLS